MNTLMNIVPGVLLAVLGVQCHAVLNLEELKNSFYTLQISDVPIPRPLSQESPSYDFGEDTTHMEISSKFGQKYVCHYKQTLPKVSEDAEEKIVDINITDLLEPMTGHCLLKTKDWWSYEFCYGQQINQFHLHEGKKSGATILLGKYQSDQTWLPEDLAKLKKSTVNRYHTQQYVNGSICDLTQQSRKTEVRFSCVEGEVDRIGAVAELESCSYIIFVYTSKICHHPYLRPPTQAKPSTISCQPIISQEAYDKYKLYEEEAARTSQEEANIQFAEAEKADSLLKELMGGSPKVAEKNAKDSSLESASQQTDTSQSDHMANTLKSQQEKMLTMLAEAMAVGASKDTVAKYKEDIRKFVSAQFDDIIAEAKGELESQGEGTGDDTLPDVNKMKNIMSSVLDEKLDELEALEEGTKRAEAAAAASRTTEGQPIKPESPQTKDDAVVATEDISTPQPPTPKTTKKFTKENIKIEIIRPQLEVEMIDIENIDENSEYYDTAKKAKQQASDSKADTTMKTVIAVLRPMQQKGTRQEEVMHSKLTHNYEKKWDTETKNKNTKPVEPHEEL